MVLRIGGLRLTALAGFAAAGLMGGHLLDYLLLAPNAAYRHQLLQQTGHSYLPGALHAAIGLAIAGAFTTFCLGYARGRRRSPDVPVFGSTALLLATIQATGFVVLESAERLLAGGSPLDSAGPIIGIGFALQFLVGATAGLLILLLDRAGERVAGALGNYRRRAAREPRRVKPADDEPAIRWLGLSSPIRAPPQALPL